MTCEMEKEIEQLWDVIEEIFERIRKIENGLSEK